MIINSPQIQASFKSFNDQSACYSSQVPCVVQPYLTLTFKVISRDSYYPEGFVQKVTKFGNFLLELLNSHPQMGTNDL